MYRESFVLYFIRSKQCFDSCYTFLLEMFRILQKMLIRFDFKTTKAGNQLQTKVKTNILFNMFLMHCYSKGTISVYKCTYGCKIKLFFMFLHLHIGAGKGLMVSVGIQWFSRLKHIPCTHRVLGFKSSLCCFLCHSLAFL